MHGKYTVAETLSQSEMNAWNPVPSTEPAVLQQLHSSKIYDTKKSDTAMEQRYNHTETSIHRQAGGLTFNVQSATNITLSVI